jgi:DNA-binding transcriptional regulator LsrR (DeoR family)
MPQNKDMRDATAGSETRPKAAITELSHLERMSAVCELFTRGKTVREILVAMVERYGNAGKMKRETPYKLVREAGERGFLKYVAPPDHAFERCISNHYLWLKRVNVVRTVVPLDVARETAAMLLRLVQDCHKNNQERNEVHIGFAAGLSMREVAQSFATLLTYPVPDLPETIVFHALLSGHDPGDPTTDPNNFFTFFLHPPTLQIKTQFVGFRAPAMVSTASMPEFMGIKEIIDAREVAKELDIIVTSGSDWKDPDSSLLRCMERSASTLETLRAEGTVGDMLWRPLSETSPVTTPTELRALTLLELNDLPEFIARGKHVLLMLGPCAKCNRHKGAILKFILSQAQHLVSHVVADSRTAGYLVKWIEQRFPVS